MTYDERQKWVCEQSCSHQKDCGYYKRGMIDDCIYIQNVMYGWELGQKDTLEEIEKSLIGCRRDAYGGLILDIIKDKINKLEGKE